MGQDIRIRQVRGLAGKSWRKRLIVKSTLGLRRIGHEVCRKDIRAVREAIRHVSELVQIVGEC